MVEKTNYPKASPCLGSKSDLFNRMSVFGTEKVKQETRNQENQKPETENRKPETEATVISEAPEKRTDVRSPGC